VNESTISALSWLRFSVARVSQAPTISDWYTVYDFLDKQKILGVCSPLDCNVRMDQTLLFKWIGSVEQIKASSALLNQRTIELCKILEDDGWRCCVLKGQGNAQIYPNPLLRQPGDIDVWIDADEEQIDSYVKSKFPDAVECFKHIKFPIFNDVEVDIHHIPLKFRPPRYQRKIQQWLETNKEDQFGHKIVLAGTDRQISVPTAEFNAVYQLGHIMIHLLAEGVGFRHFIDYYYVLNQLEGTPLEIKEQICHDWKQLGMMRLASAVMWIEYEVLGLRESLLLTTPDKRLGSIILEDVLEGGNFGKYAKRHTYVGPFRICKRYATLKRLIKLSPIAFGMFFPHAVRLIWKIIAK